ncbi:hypothetical protein TorRG33x02_096860 [Trema orientale]|uniref:Uncharacterized protein n=1 Tax=Trema orientale TaxID=63057 RepID=A0A2P5F9H1_TREOI|nr:hypothetical protein TorRG33x02_096860 [Trema orientale]
MARGYGSKQTTGDAIRSEEALWSAISELEKKLDAKFDALINEIRKALVHPPPTRSDPPVQIHTIHRTDLDLSFPPWPLVSPPLTTSPPRWTIPESMGLFAHHRTLPMTIFRSLDLTLSLLIKDSLWVTTYPYSTAINFCIKDPSLYLIMMDSLWETIFLLTIALMRLR